MSVRTKTKRFIPFDGLDQNRKASPGGADKVINMRTDDQGLGWVADRGLEQWWKPKDTAFTFKIFEDSAFTVDLSSYLKSKTDAIYVWNKQNSGQSYYIVERDGILFYWLGNKGTTDYFRDAIVISKNRHVPKGKDIGTQFIPFGNRLLILNGYDTPLWFYGHGTEWEGNSRPFGYTMTTPYSNIHDIDMGYFWHSQLTNAIAAPRFSPTHILGLGDVDTGDINQYTYKFSFISDTGSESPLSPPTTVSWEIFTNTEDRKMGVVFDPFPTGPKGTVARNIYRTKNQKIVSSEGAGGQLYYVNTVYENASSFYADAIPDGDLIDKAPTLTSSVVINSNFNYAANWNGRMWLGGGPSSSTKIIYSKSGLPEEFNGNSYFELGNMVGGAITGMIPYYNNLLVFREDAIDIIRSSNGTNFSVGQVSTSVGTRAVNTIKQIDNVGVCFLADDGVYVISGGLDGGSTIKLNKISQKADKEIKTLNITAINRAVAGYSKKEREYWVHFPTDSDVIPNRGLVLHTDTMQWSSRHGTQKQNEHMFNFSAMTVDKDGTFLIGTAPIWMTAAGGLGGDPKTSGDYADLPYSIYMWSGAEQFGTRWTSQGGTTQLGWDFDPTVDNDLPTSVYESSWISLEGSDVKTRVLSVEIEIVSEGDNKLKLLYSTDGLSTKEDSGSQKQAQPETQFTTKEDPVFGLQNSSVTKSVFTLGKNVLQDERIIRLRYDVNTGLIDTFKFRLQNELDQTPFHLLSYSINYSSTSQLPLNTNTKV